MDRTDTRVPLEELIHSLDEAVDDLDDAIKEVRRRAQALKHSADGGPNAN